MNPDPAVAGRRPTNRPHPGPLEFLEGIHAPEWMSRGLCAQTDPEAFFPEKGGSTREAKAICLTCDVRTDCLAYALANEQRFGIWGGLSEIERRRLKATPTGGDRPCRREGCDQVIPVTAHQAKKYHDTACANQAREDLIIAGLDHDRIVNAYRGGVSVTVIAKRQRVPGGVISRILAEQGVRRIRGRRQEAS